MERVITQDTDIIREYLAALDAKERSLSPFARLAGVVKLTQLRHDLNAATLETTDADVIELKREIDERLNKTFFRRLVSLKWGARLTLLLMLILFQQLVIAICWFATWIFSRFMPHPSWWNPLHPYEEPVSLYVFVFLFFFVTPMLAVAAVFAGRFLRSWRKTLPFTILIIGISLAWTVFIFKRMTALYPVKPVVVKSIASFAKERGVEPLKSYQDWVKENWLLSDTKFQRDYENYLRSGPGRWVTSKLPATNDAAWRDGLPILNEYIDGGQDKKGFTEWLTYYLNRNRIYSEDRVEQEATAIANQTPYLDIWQVEPFLRDRDQHLYRAYLGDVNRAMKKWGIVNLGIYALLFLFYYLIGPFASFLEQLTGRGRRVNQVREAELVMNVEEIRRPQSKSGLERFSERYFAFPERSEIYSVPFSDEPFKLVRRAHRAFMGLAIFTGIIFFLIWIVFYVLQWSSGRLNAPTQTALMRSYLLFGGSADDRRIDGQPNEAPSRIQAGNRLPTDNAGNVPANVAELDAEIEENEYAANQRFKEQYKVLNAQSNEIDSLRALSGQLEQTTSQFPNQVAEAGSRASAAEARAGQALGDINATKQKTDVLEKAFATKLSEIEGRATRAAEQAGQIAVQTSQLDTRTEALEKELDRRAKQVEARTEELGERTASLIEREERLSRLQRITFSALVNNLKAEVETLDSRLDAGFYRTLQKGAASREVALLRERVSTLAKELKEAGGDLANQFTTQLEQLSKRLEQVTAKAQ